MRTQDLLEGWTAVLWLSFRVGRLPKSRSFQNALEVKSREGTHLDNGVGSLL